MKVCSNCCRVFGYMKASAFYYYRVVFDSVIFQEFERKIWADSKKLKSA